MRISEWEWLATKEEIDRLRAELADMRARVQELEGEVADHDKYNEGQYLLRREAEARLAAVIALCDDWSKGYGLTSFTSAAIWVRSAATGEA